MCKGMVVLTVVMLLNCGNQASECKGGANRLRLPQMDLTADPNRDHGLREIIRAADGMIAQSEDQERALREHRSELLSTNRFAEMSYTELKSYFSEPRHFTSDKDRRGWKELRRLAAEALQASDFETVQDYSWKIREIAAAMRNNHRSPSPPHMDMLQPPLYCLDYARNPIGKGERPAYNLERGSVSDISLLDPRPSTFWSRPASVPSLDLYHGFGRTNLPDYEGRMWRYAGPKTSYGGCPGFEAESGGVKIKVKFAETTSEPFTARIFWALGYHVEPTDYVHSLRLKYDRRFFREFHLRKDVQMKIRALFIPVHVVNLQERHDPFVFIHEAILKNGQRIPGPELKARLLLNPEVEHPEDFPENFQTDFEAELDSLITTPANVQTREENIKSIGPWDFQGLDHAERREVRAAGLLGAWVGWFDSRFENTRLKIVRVNGGRELRHYFTDLGGGLGKASGVLSRHCECPNDFGWRFTRPPKPQGRGKMTIPFRILDYQPIEDTEAFRQMTYDDARWMGRLIGQMTELQIVQALIGAGFDCTEVKIFAEKLLSRRDWMIRDLDLKEEIGLLRPGQINTSGLSYDPSAEPPPYARVAGGQIVTARNSELVIQHGQVVPELHTRTSQQRARLAGPTLPCPLHDLHPAAAASAR